MGRFRDHKNKLSESHTLGKVREHRRQQFDTGWKQTGSEVAAARRKMVENTQKYVNAFLSKESYNYKEIVKFINDMEKVVLKKIKYSGARETERLLRTLRENLVDGEIPDWDDLKMVAQRNKFLATALRLIGNHADKMLPLPNISESEAENLSEQYKAEEPVTAISSSVKFIDETPDFTKDVPQQNQAASSFAFTRFVGDSTQTENQADQSKWISQINNCLNEAGQAVLSQQLNDDLKRRVNYVLRRLKEHFETPINTRKKRIIWNNNIEVDEPSRKIIANTLYQLRDSTFIDETLRKRVNDVFYESKRIR